MKSLWSLGGQGYMQNNRPRRCPLQSSTFSDRKHGCILAPLLQSSTLESADTIFKSPLFPPARFAVAFYICLQFHPIPPRTFSLPSNCWHSIEIAMGLQNGIMLTERSKPEDAPTRKEGTAQDKEDMWRVGRDQELNVRKALSRSLWTDPILACDKS